MKKPETNRIKSMLIPNYNNHMAIETITLLPAYLYFLKVTLFEKKLGFKALLNNLNPNWINGVVKFDMTPIWRKHGIDAKGINYYTIGNVKNGLSSRFDPLSPFYQAWLGCYIVQFDNERNWNVQDHFSLGEADQKYWLKLYGDPSPMADIPQKAFEDLGKIQISGFSGKLYEGACWSHSDVGSGNKSIMLKFLMSACANIFNFSNKSLNLIGSHFIPKWADRNKNESYQKIYLKGYFAILKLNEKTRAVLYVNAAIFENKNGVKTDYFSKIKKELKEALLATKIASV